MKVSACLILWILSFLGAYAQETKRAEYVLYKEKITIKGRTNINKFQCRLALEAPLDSLQISVTQENGGLNFSGLALKIPVDAFNCKYRLMTAEFRTLLHSKEHPFLNLTINHAEQLAEDTVHMRMNLAVADNIREELIRDCSINRQGEELVLGGKHTILLRSYNIEPPRKFFGAVVVKNELEISFEVILIRQTKKEPQ